MSGAGCPGPGVTGLSWPPDAGPAGCSPPEVLPCRRVRCRCFISVPVVIMVSVTAARVAARSRAASNGARPTAVISEVWKAGSTIGTGSASIAAVEIGSRDGSGFPSRGGFGQDHGACPSPAGRFRLGTATWELAPDPSLPLCCWRCGRRGGWVHPFARENDP